MTPRRNTKGYGELQKRRIIDAIRQQPMTEFQLAELLGVVRNTVTFHMTQLRKENRVRRASYIKSESGRPLPVYGIGGQPDAIYTPQKVRKPKQPDRVTAVKTAILMLLDKPHTTAALGEKLNKSPSVIRFYIKQMRDEKLIRIAAWKRTGARNGWAPAYKLGMAPDKALPTKLTNIEYHARRRANPEAREQEHKQRQLRDSLKKLRAKPASPFAALGL